MHEMKSTEYYKSCTLCPRACGVDRTRKDLKKGSGFCGETDRLRVAYVGPHFGEEPPITGTNGSGTIFFSGCSLKCTYCQNYQISREGVGRIISWEDLLTKIKGMILENGVHNINFVTPDHFLPHILRIIPRLKREGCKIPMVFNFSGYQSVSTLKVLEEHADIYLPDFKYAEASLAQKLSGCRDYPEKGMAAISEMVRQKGFLDIPDAESNPATQGVLVRHLILPGAVENSMRALTMLFIEFGTELPLSIMSQYHPVMPHKAPELRRIITPMEFRTVFEHAKELGFKHLFVQFPEASGGRSSFLPDFKSDQPFG